MVTEDHLNFENHSELYTNNPGDYTRYLNIDHAKHEACKTWTPRNDEELYRVANLMYQTDSNVDSALFQLEL